jgi:phospholipase/carboxylesterase
MSTEARVTEGAIEAGINLYYDLALPDEATFVRPRPLLIALHGYGSNKGWMMREARMMAPPEFAVLSLQGFHQHLKEPKRAGEPLRYGFGWLTNYRPEESVALHHRVVRSLIEKLTVEGVTDARQIFLLGFSQSVAINYRFAFTHPSSLRGVVAICGGLPGDWETSELYQETGAAIFHLNGTRDEFYPPARTNDYEEKLKQRTHKVLVKNYDTGHELIPAMREEIKNWLDAIYTSGE